MPATDNSRLDLRRRLRRRLAAPIALAVLLAGGITAMGIAAGGSTTLKSASNSKLGERIVVDSSGRTAYTLSGETARRLKCTSSQCLSIWSPVTTSAHGKLKAGKGVSGKLGRLSRKGKFQVTLGGHPLYRFSGDSAAGQANGEGIQSFGGTWHVVKASGSTTTTPTTPSTTPSYSPPAY
jgi:predicted lipoprotein with Yx(FWY)xxD motif